MATRKWKLSVLDQTPVRNNSNATEALQESIELAKLADRLGYTRYWLSEHHNTITLAGAAPEILIARLAAETQQIRVGSGGIMLPNHSTLKVAENFRLLEALHPHRIDLGMGRAPGGDRLTAQLLNPSNTFDPQEYVQQLKDLQAYLTDTATEGTGTKVRAIPRIDSQPDLWMLTSSGESAHLAAHFGMALSFAHFINPIGGAAAVHMYRDRFRPSVKLKTPMVNVGIFAFCSEDKQVAAQVQAVMDYRLLSFEKGRFDEMPYYEAIKDYQYTPGEWQRVLYNRNRMVIGTPLEVEEKITALADDYDVDEIVLATFADRKEDRLRSYELMARIFGIQPRNAATAKR